MSNTTIAVTGPQPVDVTGLENMMTDLFYLPVILLVALSMIFLELRQRSQLIALGEFAHGSGSLKAMYWWAFTGLVVVASTSFIGIIYILTQHFCSVNLFLQFLFRFSFSMYFWFKICFFMSQIYRIRASFGPNAIEALAYSELFFWVLGLLVIAFNGFFAIFILSIIEYIFIPGLGCVPIAFVTTYFYMVDIIVAGETFFFVLFSFVFGFKIYQLRSLMVGHFGAGAADSAAVKRLMHSTVAIFIVTFLGMGTSALSWQLGKFHLGVSSELLICDFLVGSVVLFLQFEHHKKQLHALYYLFGRLFCRWSDSRLQQVRNEMTYEIESTNRTGQEETTVVSGDFSVK